MYAELLIRSSYVQLLSSWVGIFATTTEEEKAEAVEQTLAALDALEGAFRECSGGKGWFGGDGVGYVDIALGGFVPAMNASEPTTGLKIVDPARMPLLAAWKERFCALDAAKAAMPPAERLLEWGKKRQAELQAAAEPNQ
jgi:glutathione S-transferase